MTYVKWRKEHLSSVSVLKRVHLSNLVLQTMHEVLKLEWKAILFNLSLHATETVVFSEIISAAVSGSDT
jgi:hypothetical protein